VLAEELIGVREILDRSVLVNRHDQAAMVNARGAMYPPNDGCSLLVGTQTLDQGFSDLTLGVAIFREYRGYRKDANHCLTLAAFAG
jgi:hypothetical protein